MIGIEMAEHRARHRAHHARRDQARARAEKDAFGVGKLRHAPDFLRRPDRLR